VPRDREVEHERRGPQGAARRFEKDEGTQENGVIRESLIVTRWVKKLSAFRGTPHYRVHNGPPFLPHVNQKIPVVSSDERQRRSVDRYRAFWQSLMR
jgi:hypothetical protein